jgi:glutathione S-transferase
MDRAEATLYVDAQYLSPYAMSAYVALLEKAIPFSTMTIDLDAEEQHKPPFRNRSLTRRVPTLEHQGLHLSESSAITEYLEEVFPPPNYPAIYPMEPIARAKARQIQAWLRSDLLPIREERPTTVIFLTPTSRPLSEKARTAAEKLFSAADALLKDAESTVTAQWCIADVDLALMLNRLVINGDEVPRKLTNYARRQWQRPTVQRWLSQKRGKG